MRKGRGGSLGKSTCVLGVTLMSLHGGQLTQSLKNTQTPAFQLEVATWWQGARRPRGLSRSQAKYWRGTIHTRGI